MLEKIREVLQFVEGFEIHTQGDIEEFKRRFTAKKGLLADLFELLKTVPKEEKGVIGKELNLLKQIAEDKLRQAQDNFENKDESKPQDLSLPVSDFLTGSRHPISWVQQKITSIFGQIGFSVADGPEIEDDWHNFTALHFPEHHPAREMQDTFFLQQNPDWILRTHTSTIQIRVMESQKPPLRILAPGRVYRNEAISARAHCYFHQIEGFCVDENVSFADLKQVLLYFVQQLFGHSVEIRLRPSYFPFTEISAEMDISCLLCHGSGCPICKHTGWVEILGCGMIDPQVLENCGISANHYSGYAFGMGIERIALLLYQVPDLRLYSQNDIRFLQQFPYFS